MDRDAPAIDHAGGGAIDQQRGLVAERYRLGAISFVDLVDAETVKAEADQSYVNAIYAYHEAVAELERVVGTDLRE